VRIDIRGRKAARLRAAQAEQAEIDEDEQAGLPIKRPVSLAPVVWLSKTLPWWDDPTFAVELLDRRRATRQRMLDERRARRAAAAPPPPALLDSSLPGPIEVEEVAS
jgi:hypothetical protein